MKHYKHPNMGLLAQVERVVILRYLDLYDGERTITAKALGISLRCLRMKLDLYRSQGFRITGDDHPNIRAHLARQK